MTTEDLVAAQVIPFPAPLALDEGDPLGPARAIAIGLAIGLVIDLLLGLVVWRLL